MGRVTSLERCRILVEARIVDGVCRDGEGWTLASEELTPLAIEGACLMDAGMRAFKGFARLASHCCNRR